MTTPSKKIMKPCLLKIVETLKAAMDDAQPLLVRVGGARLKIVSNGDSFCKALKKGVGFHQGEYHIALRPYENGLDVDVYIDDHDTISATLEIRVKGADTEKQLIDISVTKEKNCEIVYEEMDIEGEDGKLTCFFLHANKGYVFLFSFCEKNKKIYKKA